MTAAQSRLSTAAPPSLPALLARGEVLVMGVLNVTPDSFFDGGVFVERDAALAQVRRMIGEGAAIIDVGAESTRPYGGMQPISGKEEIARLEPMFADVAAVGTPVSIDTMKAEVARFALKNGATIMNDVWGLQREPAMAEVAAEHGVPIIIMHNRTAADPTIDIMKDIAAFFERSLAIAARAGIRNDNIILDPGIGFGKVAAQSLTVLARLSELATFGYPLLVGASRKRFIASVSPSEAHERLGGSIAAHVIAAQNGASIIRTHDVAETIQALQIASAIGISR
jgi:dihydropteroate synthase